MKLDSKYFDSIRVSRGRRRGGAEAPPAAAPECQWGNCGKRGLHKAPKGRGAEGEYFHFCRDHASEYNKAYNYFSGMDENEVTEFQKSAATGHRPTWSMGVHGSDSASLDAMKGAAAGDPLEILKGLRGKVHDRPDPVAERQRVVLKGARKHLQTLNLDENATPSEIKVQFKALVKLHHPDHNGGDRSSEERFREVLTAYNYLKQAGLVR
jgi:curved DNA-binding protein CbpA